MNCTDGNFLNVWSYSCKDSFEYSCIFVLCIDYFSISEDSKYLPLYLTMFEINDGNICPHRPCYTQISELTRKKYYNSGFLSAQATLAPDVFSFLFAVLTVSRTIALAFAREAAGATKSMFCAISALTSAF